MIIQPDLIAEILAERARQDAQWGGPAEDDKREPIEWIDYIEQQIMKLHDEGGSAHGADAALIRARLIKIIALGVAGVQSIDRTTQRPDADA